MRSGNMSQVFVVLDFEKPNLDYWNVPDDDEMSNYLINVVKIN